VDFVQSKTAQGSKQPQNTNKEFCLYHLAHLDYTYSERWVAFLCEKVTSENEFKKLKAVKVQGI